MDADERTRVNALIDQLNGALGEVMTYKLAVLSPHEIRPAEKNAHYMPKRVFDQLVANIQRDRNLSSVPFCWRDGDGVYHCLSGHHRVEAAATAGVPVVLVLYTDAALSKPERLAIQLSHNALVGQDNPTTLRELWTEIADVQWKVYSGLDDEMLRTLAPVPIKRLNEDQLRYQELIILFLPPEIARVKDVIERIGTATRTRFAARIEDYERFFNALLDFKEAKQIMNSATAVLAICDLVEEHLAELATADDDTRQEVAHGEA
jgi:hypothetical protein